MVVRLIDTSPLAYTVAGQETIRRHCRTWALADGSTVCLVTELPADQGMSITNAAEEVRAALESRWGVDCRIVEHYPWPDDDHYDEQARTTTGGIRWWRLNGDELRGELGPALDDSCPTSPIPRADSGQACFLCQTPTHATCRICRRALCRNCSADHHHEGYGTPASTTW